MNFIKRCSAGKSKKSRISLLWIHLMEHCCPERPLKSADILTSLAPASGHIVHMSGHIYNRIGNYKKAHVAFVATIKTDSAYMKNEGIEEIDNWNYIHNINYLINNWAHDGRLSEGLYYAERLKKMPVNKHRKKMYDAEKFSNSLDAMLWRNAKQTGKDSMLKEWFQITVNTATLELQGCIASYKGSYPIAIKLLEEAHKNEINPGYGEPPLYARPVAVSIAAAQIKAEKYDAAIETCKALLKRFPKSVYLYSGLLNAYRKKGDNEIEKEFTSLLKEAAKFADAGMY